MTKRFIMVALASALGITGTTAIAQPGGAKRAPKGEAAKVVSYEKGTLKVTLADGQTLTGKVVRRTRIVCLDDESGDGPPLAPAANTRQVPQGGPPEGGEGEGPRQQGGPGDRRPQQGGEGEGPRQQGGPGDRRPHQGGEGEEGDRPQRGPGQRRPHDDEDEDRPPCGTGELTAGASIARLAVSATSKGVRFEHVVLASAAD